MPSLQLFGNRLKHLFFRAFTNKQLLTAYCRKYDLKFRFFIKDGTGRDIYYKYGVYVEDHITSYFLNEVGIHKEDLIVDIGANIGWHSLTLSSRCAPTILSFEPDPFNFSLLKENREINQKSNIKLFNAALSDEDGTKNLHLYRNHNLGRHSFIHQKKSTESIAVPTMRLDSVLEQEGLSNRRIKLIKIDIEGYEYIALSGAREALKRTDYLLTEFTPDMMKAAGQDPMEYIRFLKSAGFTSIKKIDTEGLHEPDLATIISTNQQVNLLCSR